jgi:hypothetical protein
VAYTGSYSGMSPAANDRSDDMMQERFSPEEVNVTVQARPQPLTLPISKTAVS